MCGVVWRGIACGKIGVCMRGLVYLWRGGLVWGRHWYVWGEGAVGGCVVLSLVWWEFVCVEEGWYVCGEVDVCGYVRVCVCMCGVYLHNDAVSTSP